jgi:hypothetical protein
MSRKDFKIGDEVWDIVYQEWGTVVSVEEHPALWNTKLLSNHELTPRQVYQQSSFLGKIKYRICRWWWKL